MLGWSRMCVFRFGDFLCGWWGFDGDWDFRILVVSSYWECGKKGARTLVGLQLGRFQIGTTVDPDPFLNP